VASAYGWFESKWNLKFRTYFTMERRLALPNFDCVYTVSQHMKDKIIAGGTSAQRVRVIHTGIDVAQFAARGLRAAVRAQFGIAHDAVVVGTVSRLSAEKGHRYLLQAVRLLAPAHPRLVLLLVGDGNQRPLLEAEAKQLGLAERVHFAGFYADLPAALEAMDIYTLPSILDEGFPTSAIEAQAAGLPIVASDVGGTRETIDIESSGLLARPADPDSLAQALAKLLADDEYRRRVGDHARGWVQHSFPLSGMMRHMAQLYRDVYATPKRLL
jgi:glycosyltransferase involved in cell wall biosynthesis